jgi:hypothetical protein
MIVPGPLKKLLEVAFVPQFAHILSLLFQISCGVGLSNTIPTRNHVFLNQ